METREKPMGKQQTNDLSPDQTIATDPVDSKTFEDLKHTAKKILEDIVKAPQANAEELGLPERDPAWDVFLKHFASIQLFDASGKPIDYQLPRLPKLSAGESERTVTLTISQQQFDALTSKTRETLAQVTLAKERIAKDQKEIDLLKTETRELLSRIRAA
jgi:hypothetical protein